MNFKASEQRKNSMSPGRGQNGQMAIFVALIFQVLFVLFAMAINVALVVHDKINLQNSVDLAAYYAAQRQAEMLNAIAHTNYQIRQSWKLMSWRIRVLGQMGMDSHPTKRQPPITEDVPFPYPPPNGNHERPAVCISYYPTWAGVPRGENLCKNKITNIPPLPDVKVIAGFNPINSIIKGINTGLIQQYRNRCQYNGAYNWWFTAATLYAYRQDQANRKELIYALADNLSRPSSDAPGNFVSLDGESVRAGVEKTLFKNLTHANRESVVKFQMMNSLQGIDPKKWLPTIEVSPTAYYQDVRDRAGCYGFVKPVASPPQKSVAYNYAMGVLGGAKYLPLMQGEPPSGHLWHMSIGVEKNPWYMAYVGVQAETQPRQIFAPFGPTVTMKARAFAKPFGGRIGPWYGDRWTHGAEMSEGRKIDPHWPERADRLMNSQEDNTRIPNYSRYPGDPLGLESALAASAFRRDPRYPTGPLGLRTAYRYINAWAPTFRDGLPNDILTWDPNSPTTPQLRTYELAAIIPDLFDITYYSIEPNFAHNYFVKLRALKERLGLPSTFPMRSDLGSRPSQLPMFSVQDQIKAVVDPNSSSGWIRPDAYYVIRNKAHMLTAWMPGPGSVNYPDDNSQGDLANFGNCRVSDDDYEIKNPGSCIAHGGRTGYSVKLISRQALFSDQYQIGGVKESLNAILNPPPESQGW